MKEPLWCFCESSKPLLERCIEAANKNGNINQKWFGQFNSLNEKVDTKSEAIKKMDVDEIIENEEHLDTENQDTRLETSNITIEEQSENTFTQEINDLNPISSFDEIVENCLKNPKTYGLLAQNLTSTSIEKLCQHILLQDDLNPIFIEQFYKLFFPELLKQDNTHVSLDLLVKAKKHKKLFDELLYIIINNIDIPKHVFLEYTTTLGSEEKLELLECVCQNITKDSFLHHMLTIHSLYKDCDVSEEIQKYMLQSMKLVHHSCSNNKNFGKLLLNFLQIQKKYPVNCSELAKIIDMHASVFKKPCLNALRDIKNLQNLSQSQNLK